MMTKKRALGRGLDALLGIGADKPSPEERNGDLLKTIPVDLIQRGRFQPRLDIKPEALEDLAASIRAQGIVQPIVVRPVGEGGRYELIAGERRWRAAQIAGLDAIPAMVKSVPDRAVMSMALIENIQREQLGPLEEALALQRLIGEFQMSHQDVAEAIGRSRAAVSNLLRLLELDASVKAMLEDGEIDMGHARALLGLPGPDQLEIARRIASHGLSVRQAEALVRAKREPAAETIKAAKTVDPNVRQLEDSLAERLGASVEIKHRASGKGAVSIRYNSLDELEGILAHIR
ncbi:MAG: ParB/RepB/Spo0J family partition protein [Gammaproteobacteria bacterium]|nr:ParB/RepB/Spo0J family partition protein [Gammaproteobacteria bacterium]MBI5618994.1 ParB/RepB/Spo0J family partition protein [Gammaproteobacteria bacterium]